MEVCIQKLIFRMLIFYGMGVFAITPLRVPMVPQPDGVTCVPTCVKMVLDYVYSGLEGTDLNLGIEEICEIVGTTKDGTNLEDVKRINSNPKIKKAIPSIEFDVNYDRHTLREIEHEIEEKHMPTIAWIKPLEANDRDLEHAVVITDISRDDYKICYNDPLFGEKQMELGKFMELWERTDRTLIKVRVGEREQRLLDEWIQHLRECS